MPRRWMAGSTGAGPPGKSWTSCARATTVRSGRRPTLPMSRTRASGSRFSRRGPQRRRQHRPARWSRSARAAHASPAARAARSCWRGRRGTGWRSARPTGANTFAGCRRPGSEGALLVDPLPAIEVDFEAVMDESDVEHAITAFLCGRFGVEPPAADANLIESGVLDSMMFVDLIMFIEERFGVVAELD